MVYQDVLKKYQFVIHPIWTPRPLTFLLDVSRTVPLKADGETATEAGECGGEIGKNNRSTHSLYRYRYCISFTLSNNMYLQWWEEMYMQVFKWGKPYPLLEDLGMVFPLYFLFNQFRDEIPKFQAFYNNLYLVLYLFKNIFLFQIPPMLPLGFPIQPPPSLILVLFLHFQICQE